MSEPLLDLSLYFKQHRQQYYDLLQSVRLTGDWEAWVRFFLSGVEETAKQAGQTAKALMKLAAADERRIQAMGKAAGSALRVHRLLQAQPILSIATAIAGEYSHEFGAGGSWTGRRRQLRRSGVGPR